MVREVTVASVFACTLLGFINVAEATPGFIGEHVVSQRAKYTRVDGESLANSPPRSSNQDGVEPAIIARSRISFSTDGFRAQSQDGIRQSLTSFPMRRAWLMDRIRRVALEIHLPELPTVPFDLPPGLESAGLFATTPCARSESRVLAPSSWRGRDVTPHECLDADGVITATHDFSEALALVIRTETPDGLLEEFRHIEQLDLPAEHFALPARFRIVDLREFRHGAGPIAEASNLR